MIRQFPLLSPNAFTVRIGWFLTMGLLIPLGFMYSQCPTTSSGHQAWPKNSTVYYDLSTIPDPNAQAQIQSAVNAWNAANNVNGSGVHFVPGLGPTGARTLSFQFGNSSIDGIAAQITYWTWTPLPDNRKPLNSAVVTFYPDAFFGDGTTQMFDPFNLGAEDVYYKIALHEIGHTMGLNDVAVPPGGPCDQQDGASVMNAICDTNDLFGNIASSPQPCDNNALSSTSSPYYESGGSGCGGGTGGSGIPCTPMYRVEIDYVYVNDRPVIVSMITTYLGCW